MARKPKPSGQHKRRRSIKSFERRPGSKPTGPTILIVCEGDKTEPRYFQEIRRSLRLSSVQVEIVGDDCDSDPLSVVNFAYNAKIERDKLVKRGGTSHPLYDHIWCVIDVENPIHRTSINDAVNIVNGNSFLNIALSNPSFEYWYLLHFTETSRPFANADEVIRELENFVSNYRSTKEIDDYDSLFANTDEAINRATRILNNHVGEERPPNPSTEVHLLVKILRSIAR